MRATRRRERDSGFPFTAKYIRWLLLEFDEFDGGGRPLGGLPPRHTGERAKKSEHMTDDARSERLNSEHDVSAECCVQMFF